MRTDERIKKDSPSLLRREKETRKLKIMEAGRISDIINTAWMHEKNKYNELIKEEWVSIPSLIDWINKNQVQNTIEFEMIIKSLDLVKELAGNKLLSGY